MVLLLKKIKIESDWSVPSKSTRLTYSPMLCFQLVHTTWAINTSSHWTLRRLGLSGWCLYIKSSLETIKSMWMCALHMRIELQRALIALDTSKSFSSKQQNLRVDSLYSGHNPKLRVEILGNSRLLNDFLSKLYCSSNTYL